ncbi:MAG: hypothetical protein AMXMBFR47_36100 [Planctomycetota bacterium]
MGLVAPASSLAQPLAWAQAYPMERCGHAMAFDSDRDVLVLFGGRTGNHPLSRETWEWDGSYWRLASQEGPSAREFSRMAYDSMRGSMVLFGGMTRGGLSGETWEWDGAIWTLRATTGPPARSEHVLVFDSVRGRTFLFGGGADTSTWVWDGIIWTENIGPGPSARAYAAAAFDSTRGRVVMFGGWTGSDETWEWDGAHWVLLPVQGPPARYSHSMAYDATRDRVVVYGGKPLGCSFCRFNDTWEWDGEIWMQRQVNGPTEGRIDAAMVWDTARSELVVFGGDSNVEISPEMWISRGSDWELSGTLATPRVIPAMTYDSRRHETLLYGGYNGGSSTWIWNGGTWQGHDVAGPGERSGTAAVFDSNRGVVVLFGGGVPGPVYYDDLWEWDGFAWTERVDGDPAPAPRFGHVMCYDSQRGVIVLWGGVDDGITWEWDGANWMAHAVPGPTFRFTTAMSYDAARHVSVLFGGTTGGAAGSLDDTWEWDGASWTQKLVSGPSRRYGHRMAFDPYRLRTILYGGGGGGYGDETWEWDGNAWTRVSIPAPIRGGHAMVFDAERREMVVFGGFEHPPGEETTMPRTTWVLRACGPAIVEQPVNQARCVGGSAVFAVSAEGPEPYVYQWRKEGVELTNEPNHISGATDSSLNIVNSTPDDSGSYDCVVSNDCGSATSAVATLSICEFTGDLNCDGVVGLSDLSVLLSNFGRTDTPQRTDGDLDADGAVGLADLSIMLSAFGFMCPS